jgi:hypothetical protein
MSNVSSEHGIAHLPMSFLYKRIVGSHSGYESLYGNVFGRLVASRIVYCLRDVILSNKFFCQFVMFILPVDVFSSKM